MLTKITGKIIRAVKAVIYGPEGIGKGKKEYNRSHEERNINTKQGALTRP